MLGGGLRLSVLVCAMKWRGVFSRELVCLEETEESSFLVGRVFEIQSASGLYASFKINSGGIKNSSRVSLFKDGEKCFSVKLSDKKYSYEDVEVALEYRGSSSVVVIRGPSEDKVHIQVMVCCALVLLEEFSDGVD